MSGMETASNGQAARSGPQRALSERAIESAYRVFTLDGEEVMASHFVAQLNSA
jgi:hypothetical protein